jgi:putative redox protein
MPKPTNPLPYVEVTSLETFFQTQLEARTHRWLADEPLDDGGSDQGATPYEMLLGALGACTAITIRMYAKHKGIELRRADVQLELVPPTSDQPETQIKRTIFLEGDYDESVRQRLLQVANRCPVHKVLTHPIHIETELKA